MRTLVIYYSRDGHTKTVAEAIAAALQADCEAIRETQTRDGIKGWLTAGRDATLKKDTAIEPTKFDPQNYDLVIIGTPVWAFTMASGVRTWLMQHGKNLKRVAFFATMGGMGDKRAFQHMQELSGNITPIATASFIDKKIAANEHQSTLQEFIGKLK
jgi:flavodoxin